MAKFNLIVNLSSSRECSLSHFVPQTGKLSNQEGFFLLKFTDLNDLLQLLNRDDETNQHHQLKLISICLGSP